MVSLFAETGNRWHQKLMWPTAYILNHSWPNFKSSLPATSSDIWYEQALPFSNTSAIVFMYTSFNTVGIILIFWQQLTHSEKCLDFRGIEEAKIWNVLEDLKYQIGGRLSWRKLISVVTNSQHWWHIINQSKYRMMMEDTIQTKVSFLKFI